MATPTATPTATRAAEAHPRANVADEDHPRVAHGRIGVVLLNLGTPLAATPFAVRGYLKEFLSDRRVIDASPLRWWFILRFLVLPRRPHRVAANYAKIWLDTGESPLRYYTRRQAELLEAALGDPALVVDWAMSYGVPSVGERLEALKRVGCDRIVLLALYPQYAGAATAAAYDAAFRSLLKGRWQPAVRTLAPFYDHPAYIEALAARAQAGLAALDFAPEEILVSFHSLPRRHLFAGDPYHCHCTKTARLLSERLGRPLRLTFQSRFGREPWLEPFTDETIISLARAGCRRLVVMTPGFFSDCLETLEEIAITGRESFLAHGGEHFAALPCLNDSPQAVTLLVELVRAQLMGWHAVGGDDERDKRITSAD